MDRPTLLALSNDVDLHYEPDLWGKRADLIDRVADARAVIVRNATQVDTELLDAAPDLQLVARMGVGLDNIDVTACQARGVDVRTSIGANAISVAEYVLGTAMVLLRGPAYYATPDVLEGKWDRPKFTGAREIAGLTMGIIGFGSIGQVVGDRARALSMDVIAYDAVMPKDAAAWAAARRVDLDTLISEADVISLHCPKLPETIDLIDADVFNRIKQGAVLINSARGGIVNEAACAEALRSGQISGAALDTLDEEPINAATRTLFEGVPNLILTPHIAGVTQDSNRRIAEVAAENVRNLLACSPRHHDVNLDQQRKR